MVQNDREDADGTESKSNLHCGGALRFDLPWGNRRHDRNLTRSHGRQVEILQDGKILYTLDLAQAEDQTFTVTYEGRSNEIEIRDHQIRVKAADCPDQICVHMDWLEAAPIVCLPNRLSIQYVDGEGASGLDAVAN